MFVFLSRLFSFILDKNMPFKHVSEHQSPCIWMIETSVCVYDLCVSVWVSNEYVWCLAHKKCNKIAAIQRKKLIKPTKQHWYHFHIWIKVCVRAFVFYLRCHMCVFLCRNTHISLSHQKQNELRFIANSTKFYCRVQISYSTHPNKIYCSSFLSFVIYATS